MLLNRFSKVNRRAVAYMTTNLGGKGLAAVAQLYAIVVFTRMHSPDEAALVFLLLGYAIWFQAFEFGLAQTLQNKFNAKLVSSHEMLLVTVCHYLCMCAIAGVVGATSFFADALLPSRLSGLGEREVKAFSIGAAVLLLASNNVISQRLLLVFNKGQVGNVLVILQSALAVLGLAAYTFVERSNLVVAVLVYLGPQILIFLPVLLGWAFRILRRSKGPDFRRVREIISDSLGFWGISVLAAVFLGADYYFAAHYMSSQQVISYHVATRLFFISFVAYYAYAQHSAKRLSVLSVNGDMVAIGTITKNSAAIGLTMVTSVYVTAALLDGFNVFNSVTHGAGVGQDLLFSAFLYFIVRVCRDVGLVVVVGLNARKIIYKVYVVEIIVGLGLMYLLVPKFGGQGLFGALTLACCLGSALLVHQARKIGVSLMGVQS